MAEGLYIRNERRRRKPKQKLRLRAKAALTVCGCVLLLWLLGRTVIQLAGPQKGAEPEEAIPLQEAGNLAWLLADTAGTPDPSALLDVLKQMDASEGGGYLTAGQAAQLLDLFPDGKSRAFAEGLPAGKNARVSAEDWFGWFDGVRSVYDVSDRIENRRVTVLGVGADVTDGGGRALPEGHVFAAEAADGGTDEYACFSDRLLGEDLRFWQVEAVTRGQELYALRAVEQDAFRWRNVWLKDAGAEALTCFYEDHSVRVPFSEETRFDGISSSEETDTADASLSGETDTGDSSAAEPDGAANGRPAPDRLREQVADLSFLSGAAVSVSLKTERVSGRLLRVTQEGAEVEGQGILPFAGDCRIYRLCGSLKTLEKESLRIGYAFTDFVLEDGKICAALVPREERMENIRVLIRTSGYGGLYHDSIRLQADCDCTVFTGPSGERREQKLAAGETLEVTAEDALFGEGDRILIRPDILTGRIFLLNVERAQERPAYRGCFELLRTEDGLAVINEVLLEEYLYAVVPSEMPASYPAEALKSQAVCARTYAYAKMLRAGLAGLGAHLDDSVSYQVYQNLAENAASTDAVRLTKGQTLFWQEEPAEAYYYSTSCGIGTDASVWMEGNEEKYPYLRSVWIRSQEGFYEQEEPWFRWRYEVEELDADAMNRAIGERYLANPANVLVERADGSFVSEKPRPTGRILEISVRETGAGGVVKSLLIEGEKTSVLLKTEYNIRYVLCDRRSSVLRQDGSLAQASAILPSAFFTLETRKEDGAVSGYTLSGGGFGHGVGMSQNGARRMAMAGMCAGEILDFFYPGCEIRDIYAV